MCENKALREHLDLRVRKGHGMDKTALRQVSPFVVFSEYYKSGQIKKNKIGTIYSTHTGGVKLKGLHNFRWKT
jgi:predicted lipoprotein